MHAYTPQLLCKQITNNLIVLDFNLVLYLSDHSPLRSAASAAQISHSRLFHPSTGAPAPSVKGPGSAVHHCPVLISYWSMETHFFSIWVCQSLSLCLSVSMCELQKAPVMDTRRQPKPMGIEGTGYFCVLLLVSLCFDNHGGPWEKRKCRLTSEHWVDWGGHSHLPCCLTWWIILVRHLQPSISPILQWKARMYIFIFSIWNNSTP